MEGELWEAVYRLISEEASKRPRRKGVRYSDAWVLAVFFWAAVHDRPMCWACDERNWPGARAGRRGRGGRGGRGGRELPRDAPMSQRLRAGAGPSLLGAGRGGRGRVPDLPLWGGGRGRLASLPPPNESLVRAVDGKPLPVGGYSKDR